MIFTICLLVLLAAIVFFHTVEGFFGATLSAIFAVIAAVVAVGYHETIVESLLAGRFASESHALVLLVLFGATYLFLRLVFDPLIKGNVRVPAMVDKIGGGVMGLIAGIFALGIVAIAAQEMPFGIDVAGYARYAVLSDPRSVSVHLGVGRSDVDHYVEEELSSDKVGQFDPADKRHVFPDVDDAVIGTVSWLSKGSLAGDQPLENIHPDLLQELFAQRLGLESNANRTALNVAGAGADQVHVSSIYKVDPQNFTVADQEDPRMRRQPLTAIATLANLDKQAPDKMLLAVRIQVSHDAADPDGLFRFSPGSIRLVAPQVGDLAVAPGNYYPVGTLEGSTLYVDKPDDYLFLNLSSDRGVDLVFEVDASVIGKPTAGAPGGVMPSPAFLEVKRLARVDLGGKEIDLKPQGNLVVGVNHVIVNPSAPVPPPPIARPVAPTPGPAPAPPMAPAQPGPVQPGPQQGPPPQAPQPPPRGNPETPQGLVPTAGGQSVLEVSDVSVSTALPQSLGTSAAQAKEVNTQLPGGSAILRDGKARDLTLDQSPVASDAAKGEVTITDLVPPAGNVLLRITAKPTGDNSWEWVTHVDKMLATDVSGTTYPPVGVWATISSGGVDHLMAHYSSKYPLDDISPGTGKVTNVVLYIAVPNGTTLKQLTLDGKLVKDISGISAQ